MVMIPILMILTVRVERKLGQASVGVGAVLVGLAVAVIAATALAQHTHQGVAVAALALIPLTGLTGRVVGAFGEAAREGVIVIEVQAKHRGDVPGCDTETIIAMIVIIAAAVAHAAEDVATVVAPALCIVLTRGTQGPWWEAAGEGAIKVHFEKTSCIAAAHAEVIA